jgi:hypothetical protein
LAVKAFGEDVGSWAWRNTSHASGYMNNEMRPVEFMHSATFEVATEMKRVINDVFTLKEQGRLLQQAKARARSQQ